MDTISLFLPLPFRVFGLVVSGVFGWGLVLNILSQHGINALALVRHPPRAPPTHQVNYHLAYRLATILSLPLIGLLFVYWAGTRFDQERVPNWSTAANLYLIVFAVIVIRPPEAMRAGVSRVLSTYARILRGDLGVDPGVKFGDVLASDALVSFSKVLGDVAVVICMALDSSTTSQPRRGCGGFWLVPALTSYPTFVRMVQTLTEYNRNPANKAPLANCAKYFTNIPVIWLSAWINAISLEQQGDHVQAPFLGFAWYLCVILNSTYSFYWDVAMDWDFELVGDALQTFRGRDLPNKTAFGLRRDLRLWEPVGYYIAIAVDFVLRFTWGLKFSPRLDRLARLEGGLFAFEMLEVFRRGMWCLLRIEAQDVRESPVLDDAPVELGLLGD